MQNTLSALIKLQEIDTKLDDLLEERGDLPHIVEDLEVKSAEKKESQQQIEEEISIAKIRIKEIEKFKEEYTSRLEKYNEQLYQVKTNKEYDAITTEIETVQQSAKEFDSELIALNSSIEEKMATLSTLESELEEINSRLSENKVELDSRLAETAEEEAALNKKRAKALKKLSKYVITSYENVRNARNGLGIAKVENGNCGGCFSFIPPQKIVGIRKMEKLYECEFCGRILVWEDK